MLLKVGDHPNFMKVCGIVVKEGKKGAKPYLILEYIEGTRLRDVKPLSLKENLHILAQLKDAFTYLLSLGIVIRDGNLGNFLVAEGNLLKIIDFDDWECSSAFSEQGAQKLYAIARVVAEKLGNFNCPPHVISYLDVKQSFEESMAHLIERFRISSR